MTFVVQAMLPAEDADSKKRSLVTRTWKAMESLHAQFLDMFFRNLLADAGMAKRFAGTNLDAIKTKLAQTLSTVLTKLEDKDALVDFLQPLA